jgi:hypothetical protein
MSFCINISESNNEILFQQKYTRVDNGIIKVRNAFSENEVYVFSYTGSIVEFTIPESGTYKIEAWGARGGSNTSETGPKGAYSKSIVSLNKDEKIKILVGERGYGGTFGTTSVCSGGGGGGTFIAKDRTPLCVAGGGGSFVGNPNQAIQSHACGQATQLSANAGTGQATLKMGGKAAQYGGGGGGFEGNGADGTAGSWGKGGYSFLNGGARQIAGTVGTNYSYGGFGGGASAHGNCASPAGGGGYTGGGGANSAQAGGGGSYFEGSYNNEVSYAISGCNESLPTNPDLNGNGFAFLVLLKNTASISVNKRISCFQYKISVLWTLYATLLSQ